MTEATQFWLLAAIAAFIGGCANYLTVKGVLAALEGTRETLFRTAFYMMLAAILLFIAAWVLSLS